MVVNFFDIIQMNILESVLEWYPAQIWPRLLQSDRIAVTTVAIVEPTLVGGAEGCG